MVHEQETKVKNLNNLLGGLYICFPLFAFYFEILTKCCKILLINSSHCRNYLSTSASACLMNVSVIPPCKILLSLSSHGILPKTLDLRSTFSLPLGLVESQRTYESISRTCHDSSCNNRKLCQNQIMNLKVLVRR